VFPLTNRGSPAPGRWLPVSRDTGRGLPARAGGIGGDHRVPQIHVAEQRLDLGDLGGVVRDPNLPDDNLLPVVHGGEQLDLAIQDPAQSFAVNRDRGQQPVQSARVCQLPEPAVNQVVQEVRADRLDERAEPGLAGGEIRRSSGYGFPPSRAVTSCGRSAT
jgi:hypothetical protein